MRLPFAVVLLGCSAPPAPTSPAPPSPQPDCNAVVAATARFVDSHALRADQVEGVKSVAALRCVEDHWSAAATACIGAAATPDAAHACMRDNLTVAQHDRLMQGFRALGPDHAPDRGEIQVTAIQPDHGDRDGGTYVRIRGTGFLEPTARNAKIYFGSRQGDIIRFASNEELIVQAPGGKPDEVVDVLVIFEPGGEIKLPHAFTFVDKQPPVAIDVAPAPTGPRRGQAAIAAKDNDDGTALFTNARYPEASSKFRDAVARSPEPKFFLNLCLSLFMEGKFGEALAACNAGVKSNPDAALRAKLDKAIDRIDDEARHQGIELRK